MPDSTSSKGHLPAIKKNPVLKAELRHLSQMKATLETADVPLLGLAEPTVSAQGTRRLHETQPNATDRTQTSFRPVDTIVKEHSDFVRAQGEVQSHRQPIALPRMVQYDLFHVAEAMPETRQGAPNDQLHSFFYQQEAVDTLLDHCQYFLDREAFVMLMWHAYSPVWGNQNFYEITGQTGVDAPIRLDNSVHNPFGMLDLPGSLSRKAQQAIFREVIDGFDTSNTKGSLAFAFQRKLDQIADFAKALGKGGGSAIFRPYHEHAPDGFFWWALDNLHDEPAEAERLYRQLFHKTRDYLESQGVDNLLYAYSPDIPYEREYINKAEFIAAYQCGLPDLDQVEVLGVDAYLWKQFTPQDQLDFAAASAMPEGQMQTAACQHILARPWERILQMMAWLREEYPNKIVGLTETGWDYSKWGEIEGQPIATFWQEVGMDRVAQMPKHLRPHFICFWRNDVGGSFHPYAGASGDFGGEALAIARP